LAREKSTRMENYQPLGKYFTKYRNLSGMKFYPALLQKGLDQQIIAGRLPNFFNKKEPAFADPFYFINRHFLVLV
jgi:hypothetical protein